MENNIIEMKKENKVVKWFKDHDTEIIVWGGFLTVAALLAAVYAAGYSNGKGPKIDEWVPAPIHDADGKVGVTMLGLKKMADGNQAIVDYKSFLYEKHEYAANFANNILDLIKDIEGNS